MYYYMIPEAERPDECQKYAREDEDLWKQQSKSKPQLVDSKEQKIKDMMDDASKSIVSESKSQISDNDSMSYTNSFNNSNYDSTCRQEEKRPSKKKKTK